MTRNSFFASLVGVFLVVKGDPNLHLQAFIQLSQTFGWGESKSNEGKAFSILSAW
jgi:hypothetical protein